VRSFIREKKIYCGDDYREVDIFPYTTAQKKADGSKTRSKKVRESEPKQKNLNDKNARRYLIQLGNLNFGSSDLHVTATYDKRHLPPTIEEAEKEASNFLRRVQYRRKKEGLPPLKYILVTSYSTNKKGDKPTRVHHHIIMNGGLDRDTVENLWRERKRAGQKQGDKIGYINADRLQMDDNGIAALCAYLARNPGGKKRWSSSQNLKRPTSRANDARYTRKQVEKICKEQPGREFWEKQYPGWTLTDGDYGVRYEYNEHTGWSIYLKLRKLE
jgi:ABC-type transporter Mla MlaB component